MNRHRFTIFDAAEAAGVFDANPANSFARSKDGQSLFSGPVEYPKILYHPVGETKIIVNGTAEMTPFGPKYVNEQREMIWKEVKSPEEEKELRKAGWHDHPAKAIAEGNKSRAPDKVLPVPAISSVQTIAELQAQLAKTQEALKIAEANQQVGKVERQAEMTLADKLTQQTAAAGLA